MLKANTRRGRRRNRLTGRAAAARPDINRLAPTVAACCPVKACRRAPHVDADHRRRP